MRLLRVFPALAALGSVLPFAAGAQVKASEAASVSQTVDGTVMTVEYSRPRARGRDALFGGEVKWDEVWTPGANWATTLEVNKDVTVDGHPLAKGKYSVWMVVRPGDWTAVFDPRSHLFHTRHPDSTDQQLRFTVTPEQSPFLEVLTWSFPEVRVNGTTLVMQWGTYRVPLHLAVTPSYQQTVSKDEAARYVGSWTLQWKTSNWGDTTKVASFTVTQVDGALRGEWVDAPWPEAEPFLLLPIRQGWFSFGAVRDGELYEIWSDMVFEFHGDAGRAASYDLRGEKDELIAAGARR